MLKISDPQITNRSLLSKDKESNTDDGRDLPKKLQLRGNYNAADIYTLEIAVIASD